MFRRREHFSITSLSKRLNRALVPALVRRARRELGVELHNAEITARSINGRVFVCLDAQCFHGAGHSYAQNFRYISAFASSIRMHHMLVGGARRRDLKRELERVQDALFAQIRGRV